MMVDGSYVKYGDFTEEQRELYESREENEV